MRRVAVTTLLFGALAVAVVAQAQSPAKTPAQGPGPAAPTKSGLTLHDVNAKPWTGDFDGMVKRRVIRVLVPYSKTYYFVDRAMQHGVAYRASQLLERHFNDKLKSGSIRLRVQCIPVNRGEMIPALLAGRGDFAAHRPYRRARNRLRDGDRPFGVDVSSHGVGVHRYASHQARRPR